MPRELIHWSVLKSSLVDAPSEIADCIKNHLPEAFLGASAHDIGYFHELGKGRLSALSELLHGAEGEDTNKPLLELLSLAETEKEKSFVLGMFSHAVVDRVFHPCVYFLTGDYYAPDKHSQHRARVAHRLFEVYLDTWVRVCGKDPSENLRLDTAANISTKLLGHLAKKHNIGTEMDVRSATKDYLRLRRAFVSKPLGMMFRLANFCSLKKLSGIDSLFVFGRDRLPVFLNQPLCFNNPVSGESFSKTVSELHEEATSGLQMLWQDLAKGPESIGEGKSLNFNLLGATKLDATHFADANSRLCGG